MNIAILVIGREILRGIIQDTNSFWLAREIFSLGLFLKEIRVVDDDLEDIRNAVKEVVRRGMFNVLITTGGLGPTPDDKTLEGISMALGLELKLNKKAKEMVEQRYKELYEEGKVEDFSLTSSRLKMAYLPEGAEPLFNPVGAAPGVRLNYKNMEIFVLPGVPKEMKFIFEKYVKTYLEKYRRFFVKNFSFILEEQDESKIADVIKEFSSEDTYLKTRPESFGKNIKLEIIIRSKDEKGIEVKVNQILEKLKQRGVRFRNV